MSVEMEQLELDLEGVACKFRIGQTVIWRGGWGTQPPKSARIVDTGEKNGRAVYDLDNGHWAYEYQLEEV